MAWTGVLFAGQAQRVVLNWVKSSWWPSQGVFSMSQKWGQPCLVSLLIAMRGLSMFSGSLQMTSWEEMLINLEVRRPYGGIRMSWINVLSSIAWAPTRPSDESCACTAHVMPQAWGRGTGKLHKGAGAEQWQSAEQEPAEGALIVKTRLASETMLLSGLGSWLEGIDRED